MFKKEAILALYLSFNIIFTIKSIKLFFANTNTFISNVIGF